MFTNPLLHHLAFYKEGFAGRCLLERYNNSNNNNNHTNFHNDERYERENRGCGVFLSCWAVQNRVVQNKSVYTPPSNKTFPRSPNTHDFSVRLHYLKPQHSLEANLDLRHLPQNQQQHRYQHHNVTNNNNNNKALNELSSKERETEIVCHLPSLACHKSSLQQVTERLNRRRSRTNFSEEQLEALESTFQQHHYPHLAVCESLSKELSLASSTIQIWFQNRRAKWRRQEHTRRGPGRPSNNAPRRSCSGEPIRTEEEEAKASVESLKSTRKKSVSVYSSVLVVGRESLCGEAKEFERSSFDANVKALQWDDDFSACHSHDEDHNRERTSDLDSTHSSHNHLKAKYNKINANYLPFNIENLLAN